MEMEFEFKDNYDQKVSINHSLKKIDRSVDSFQFIDWIRYKYQKKNRSAILVNKIYIFIVFNSFSQKKLSFSLRLEEKILSLMKSFLFL